MGFDFVNIKMTGAGLSTTTVGATTYTPVVYTTFMISGSSAVGGARASSSLAFANGLLVSTGSWVAG